MTHPRLLNLTFCVCGHVSVPWNAAFTNRASADSSRGTFNSCSQAIYRIRKRRADFAASLRMSSSHAKSWHVFPTTRQYKESATILLRHDDYVIEIGAASGATTSFLSSYCYKAVGVDHARTELDLARSRYPFVEFYQVDATYKNELKQFAEEILPRFGRRTIDAEEQATERQYSSNDEFENEDAEEREETRGKSGINSLVIYLDIGGIRPLDELLPVLYDVSRIFKPRIMVIKSVYLYNLQSRLADQHPPHTFASKEHKDKMRQSRDRQAYLSRLTRHHIAFEMIEGKEEGLAKTNGGSASTSALERARCNNIHIPLLKVLYCIDNTESKEVLTMIVDINSGNGEKISLSSIRRHQLRAARPYDLKTGFRSGLPGYPTLAQVDAMLRQQLCPAPLFTQYDEFDIPTLATLYFQQTPELAIEVDTNKYVKVTSDSVIRLMKAEKLTI